MIIHKCDRCGKVTEQIDQIIYPDKHCCPSMVSADLCDECYASFRDWLKGTENLSKDPHEDDWAKVTDKTERNGG